MLFPADAIEYVTVTFTSYPTGAAADASTDRSTWTSFEIPVTAQSDGTWAGKILLRGPNVTASTAGRLVANGTPVWVRVHNDPELITALAGTIYLT